MPIATSNSLVLRRPFESAERSTVSVVTRTLQTAGMIRQSRGGITVIDRAGLEETSCECYGKIRRLYQRLLPGSTQHRPRLENPPLIDHDFR